MAIKTEKLAFETQLFPALVAQPFVGNILPRLSVKFARTGDEYTKLIELLAVGDYVEISDFADQSRFPFQGTVVNITDDINNVIDGNLTIEFNITTNFDEVEDQYGGRSAGDTGGAVRTLGVATVPSDEYWTVHACKHGNNLIPSSWTFVDGNDEFGGRIEYGQSIVPAGGEIRVDNGFTGQNALLIYDDGK